MVTQPTPLTDSVFDAVADPTRRAILDLLRGRELSAGDIASRFPVSRPAISRHLRILREAGLLRESREAQSRRYTLNPAPLDRVERWLHRYRGSRAGRRHELRRSAKGRRHRA
jgi:DNA-binding transcriptional ArsR family regulator